MDGCLVATDQMQKEREGHAHNFVSFFLNVLGGDVLIGCRCGRRWGQFDVCKVRRPTGLLTYLRRYGAPSRCDHSLNVSMWETNPRKGISVKPCDV